MKTLSITNKTKNGILTLGILVALFLGLQFSAFASTGEKNPKKTETELTADEKATLEKIYKEVDFETEETSFQIYDIDFNLVYESTCGMPEDDKELQLLLLKSNHVMNFNHISYFMLEQ